MKLRKKELLVLLLATALIAGTAGADINAGLIKSRGKGVINVSGTIRLRAQKMAVNLKITNNRC